jgi:hypothetical protein
MKFSKNLVVSSLVLAATASQAAAIDVAAIVTDIGAQAAPVALVAGAVLLIHLAVKGFKWVRAAMA